VGDSSIAGAGNYASSHIAASCTGTGEFVIRSLATRAISEAVEHGARFPEAMREVLEQMGRDFDADVGIIGVDRHGVPVAVHRTRDMPHAFFAGEAPVVARMRVA
jgi:beta-aspartyl-peptidase (threonine type)